MKKHIILFLSIGLSLVLTTSCLKEYLDKAPEQGLSEATVFSKLSNFYLYFDAVYNGQKYYNGSWQDKYNIKCASAMYFDWWDQKYAWETTTDCTDNGRYMEGHAWKSGQMSETIVNKMTYDGARRPILESMFLCIRISNVALQKVDGILDAKPEDIEDLRGQAYFIRAYCHFAIFKIWGTIPYQVKPLGPDDVWDIERPPSWECLEMIAKDCDSAYNCFRRCGKVRRDPMPATPGSLDYNQYQMYRPNGMAAKALKSRALLYLASPQNTDGAAGRWEAAAEASWDALACARDTFGVSLLTLANRYQNFYSLYVCSESIWTWCQGSKTWNAGSGSGDFSSWFCGQFMANTGSASGLCPTQNWVDKYETKWGDPLNTAADRIAAGANYNEQDMFTNRDPRLLTDIIYNQSPCQGWSGNVAQIWTQGTTVGELLNTSYLGRTFTGYLMRKFWANNSTKNTVSSYWSDPLFRLAELYLNYAEAANEAYGPGGSFPGSAKVAPSPMTAVAALNAIRTRAGMPGVLAAYTGSTTALRPRIKNERNVEFSFEGHYYYDIRRWMDLKGIMSSTLYAVIPIKTTVSPTYPKGYIMNRTELSADRQPMWKPQMYYLPFNNADYLKMGNFVGNPVW